MKKRNHPDQKLTLRQAFEKHYDKSDLQPCALRGYRDRIRHWERHTSDPPVGKITDDTLDSFRKALIAAELSPATINADRKGGAA